MPTPVSEQVSSEMSQTLSASMLADLHVCKEHDKTINVLYVIDQLSVLGGGERAMIRMIQAHSTRFQCRVVTFRKNIHPEVRERMSVPIHVIPLVRTHSLEGLTAGCALRRLIFSERIDIVHTFFETSDLFAGVVAKLSGVKVLISSRRDMGLLRSRKHHVAYRLVGRLFSRVLTVSEAVRKHVLTVDRLPPDRVTTVYTGIQLAERRGEGINHAVRRIIGVSPRAPVVLSVANIVPWKGHRDFLEAAAVVHRRIPETHFVVAGAINDSELFAALLSRRDALGLGGCFHFLGEVDFVRFLYQTASVFCLLSHTEGLPNVVLEAMAASVPVVATDSGGTAEIVIHGKTGFVIPVGAVDQAAENICRLLLSPREAREISEAARNRVESMFSMERMMATVEGIYESSLAIQ